MKFTTKIRGLIQDRAKHRCELCGTPLREAGQIHHRRPRGMGGTKNPESRSAANGLYLHLKCHQVIEQNRSDAREYGWIVPQGLNPRDVPVRLHHGWVLLNEDGTYQTLADAQTPIYQQRFVRVV